MRNRIALAAMLAACTQTNAADTRFDDFTPLAASAASLPVGDAGEAAPFVLSSPNFTQVSIADRATQLARGQGNSGTWDMQTVNETGADAGRYLFTPFETLTAGVQRIDLWNPDYNTRTVTIVAPGTQFFVAGDASRWTPWGSYLTAEEAWSDPGAVTLPFGRLFEITNPTAAPGSINFVRRPIGPADIRVAHEGLAFDRDKNFYFIDERNDSHIFRFTSANPNATNGADFFAAGTTSVLRVGDGTAKEATGAYTWIALTDAGGAALPGTVVKTDFSGLTVLDGRATPNVAAFLGTGFDRPEDIEIKTLPDGRQLLFVATTTNHKVFALDLANNEIRLFAGRDTPDMATGAAIGNAFTNPDNLAIDAEGNIYIVEDQGGGIANIWFARDADNDGVAEALGVWATLKTDGAEPSGLYFDPLNPNVAYVNVQHPSSGTDRTVMIAAVPEPGTYALMLAGLGMVGWTIRRRRAG